jgi:hypothetical protein
MMPAQMEQTKAIVPSCPSCGCLATARLAIGFVFWRLQPPDNWQDLGAEYMIFAPNNAAEYVRGLGVHGGGTLRWLTVSVNQSPHGHEEQRGEKQTNVGGWAAM